MRFSTIFLVVYYPTSLSRWEQALRPKVKRVVADTKPRLIGSADEDVKVFKLKKEEKTQLQLMVEKMPKVALVSIG